MVNRILNPEFGRVSTATPLVDFRGWAPLFQSGSPPLERHTPEPQQVRFAMIGLTLMGGCLGASGVLPALWSLGLALDVIGAGLCFAAMAVAMLLATVAAGRVRVAGRLPARGIASTGAAVLGVALILVSFADRESWLVYPVALAGVGAGLIAAGTGETLSRALTRRRGSALLHLGGVFFGFGAAAVCCCAWVLADNIGWRNLCLLYASIALMLAWIIRRGPQMVFEDAGKLPWSSAKLSPIMVLLFLTLLIQAGSHGLLGGWLALYLTRQFEITTLGSLGVLMAFWIALTCGRVYSGRLSALGSRTRSAVVVSGFVVLGCLFLLNSVEPSGGVVGALLLGAGMGALHPLTLEYVSHSPGAPAERMFRFSFAMTLVVGAGSAAAAAPLANTHGIDAVMWLALWLAVATPLALAVIALGRAAQRRGHPGRLAHFSRGPPGRRQSPICAIIFQVSPTRT